MLVAMACYFSAFFGVFQYDDYQVIVDYAGVHSWQAWLNGIGHGIRPLLKFSYMLDWALDPGTFSFHLTNLLIHLACTWLVYRLAAAFVQRHPRLKSVPDVPLFTALLFAVHPVHTEAVTYISGRSVSLMTLFYLGALLGYINGREHHKPWQLYLLTPLLFALALGVKETAVTFPFALLLWDACSGGLKGAIRRQWPTWAVLLAVALLFLFNDSYQTQMRYSANFNDLMGNVATQLNGFAWLARQWLLPLWPNIDPDLPVLHDLSAAVLPLAFLPVLCLCAVWAWRTRPWLTFALGWAILQLLPLYLLLPRLDIANERQLYIVSGPLLLALCIELALPLRTAHFRHLAATLMLVLAALTIMRNLDYASEVALWQATAKLSPDKARVHNNLGYAYLLDDRDADARREFERALQLDPEFGKARNNLERMESMQPGIAQ